MTKPRSSSPSAEVPFERQFVEVKGPRIADIEDGEGPVVLFSHGGPTSSYLWCNVIPFVSDDAAPPVPMPESRPRLAERDRSRTHCRP
ncbi:hypothetical protein AAD018_014395 [Aestuariibius insulae]|uniref:hypothetical protein n=1 Tax=Aestuariibius insulae TaxID=2058287 RepID=UPI00345EE55E